MKFYVFTVLPLGLWSAPHELTKIFNPLERSIGGVRIFALLFFSTTNGVFKRILKCVGLSLMPLELTYPRRFSLQTRRSRCGHLVTGLTDWVSLEIVLVDLLKLSIGGLSGSLIPLTISLPLILFTLPED